ncbi:MULTISPECIES: hypothetical protein [unclassified Streptomyces]|uniref:hypothetical protein n=1 Tax=unclassified Streptomyces TaxID=2593676 RepID=UPI002E17E979
MGTYGVRTASAARCSRRKRNLLLRLDQQSVVAIAPNTGRPLWVFQGVGEAEFDNGLWRVSAGSRTAVFSREFGKHDFALPIG